MTATIISVENLGKSYLLGHESAGNGSYMALRDVLGRHVKNFARKALDMARGRQIVQGDEIEEFWALRDVTFNVHPGEVVGIVGGNGAGKSTLLKVLSRITEPTQGKITLRGRVASLLEVGTGFHPELSGRENIFLNGAILGMSQKEVKRKFDEIVEFAEVERFLDTPVKRYSSGMYVRLAFAVAAHLDPEILVVDEVLAVGDAQFQKKCLGKMQAVSRQQGRTVLFVSHNMAAIKALCTRAICLEKGRVVADDLPDPVIQRYYHAGETEDFDGRIPKLRARQMGTGQIQFTQIVFHDVQRQFCRAIETGSELNFVVRFSVLDRVAPFFLELGIMDAEGRQLTQSRFPYHTQLGLHLDTGDYEIHISLELTLFPGSYSVLLGAHQLDGTTVDWVERCLDFEVLNAAADSTEHHPWAARGFFRPCERWSGVTLLNSNAKASL